MCNEEGLRDARLESRCRTEYGVLMPASSRNGGLHFSECIRRPTTRAGQEWFRTIQQKDAKLLFVIAWSTLKRVSTKKGYVCVPSTISNHCRKQSRIDLHSRAKVMKLKMRRLGRRVWQYFNDEVQDANTYVKIANAGEKARVVCQGQSTRGPRRWFVPS